MLLSEELAIFGQIRELTVKQADILAADDLEALDESLSRRQELIEKINGLHQETDLLMQSYISFSKAGNGKEIEAIAGASETLRGVIAECAALNEKNISSAKGMNEEYVKRIDDLSQTRKGIGAYAQNMPNDSELFDAKT